MIRSIYRALDSSLAVKLGLPTLVVGLLLATAGTLGVRELFERQLNSQLITRADLIHTSIRAATRTAQSEEMIRIVNLIGAERDIESIIIVSPDSNVVIESTRNAMIGMALNDLPDSDALTHLKTAASSGTMAADWYYHTNYLASLNRSIICMKLITAMDTCKSCLKQAKRADPHLKILPVSYCSKAERLRFC